MTAVTTTGDMGQKNTRKSCQELLRCVYHKGLISMFAYKVIQITTATTPFACDCHLFSR